MNPIREFIKKLVPEALKFRYRIFRKHLKKRKLERIYSGNQVVCLICGRSYRIFAPFKHFTNEMCINCGSMKRHRLLYKFLRDEMNFFQKSNQELNLLHFAPEKAFYDIFSRNSHLNYYPSDLEPASYNFYYETKIYKADITNIPFKSCSFDVILCNHVLEHIEDDSKAMNELYRVMKKGGWGIFQVPIDFERDNTYEDFSKTTPEERYVAFGQMDHVRWYGKDYPQRLAKAGLDVSDIRYTDKFSEEEKFKYGFPEKESIYFCEKT